MKKINYSIIFLLSLIRLRLPNIEKMIIMTYSFKMLTMTRSFSVIVGVGNEVVNMLFYVNMIFVKFIARKTDSHFNKLKQEEEKHDFRVPYYSSILFSFKELRNVVLFTMNLDKTYALCTSRATWFRSHDAYSKPILESSRVNWNKTFIEIMCFLLREDGGAGGAGRVFILLTPGVIRRCFTMIWCCLKHIR